MEDIKQQKETADFNRGFVEAAKLADDFWIPKAVKQEREKVTKDIMRIIGEWHTENEPYSSLNMRMYNYFNPN